MKKYLRWIQVILLIVLAKSYRLPASPKRELSVSAEEDSENLKANLLLLHAIDLYSFPGIKPEFSKSHKNRKGPANTESDEPEQDYPYKKFDPLNPPPRDRTVSKTFRRITEKARGQLFEIVPKEVPETVKLLVTEKAQPNTDLVFLIDQTGSMSDDIDNIRGKVGKTLEAYKDTPNFRVGATTYSAVKTDGAAGFSLHELESDHSYLPGFLRNIKFLGGIEDMFGGVVKTVQLIQWRNGSKRIIIVLTDEPPETDPRCTDYTEKEMLEIVKRAKIELNVVLIG